MIIPEGYTHQKTLSQNSTGTTCLVKSEADGQLYVLKQKKLTDVVNWKEAELFKREIATLRQLNHPHIPTFQKVLINTDHSEHITLVQEYIAGESLQHRVESGQHFTEQEVITLILQVARTLAYLHGFSPPIIHRDVKPANLVLYQWDVFLVDYGAVHGGLSRNSSTIVGTFGYMAPEQFEGRAYPGTDIYALGMTFVFLLTHKHPVDMRSASSVLAYREHTNLSPQLCRVIDRMIAPDQKKRYTDTAPLIQDLERLLAGQRLPLKGTTRAGIATTLVAIIGLAFSFFSPGATKVPEVPQAVDKSPPAFIDQKLWRGKLTYRGKILNHITSKDLHFLFVDPKDRIKYLSAGRFSPEGHYKDGYMWFTNLPVNQPVRIDLLIRQGENENEYTYSKTFTPDPQHPEPLNFPVQKIIYMLLPENSHGALKGKYGVGGPGELTEWDRLLHFAWEAIDADARYTYQITEREGNSHSKAGTRKVVVAEGTLTDTAFRVYLAPSAPNSHYYLTIQAQAEEEQIGYLQTFDGRLDYPGYAFRVK